MNDEVARAISIGEENQEFIALGKAWCTHIRTDRSGLGVGMVEEMIGLPITGGRFTCDFARKPGGFTGMQLSASALGFYEDNCRGCPHRSPGGRIPNLGTWAEPLLAERAQHEEAEAEAQKAAVEERERRAAHRRLVSALFSAASQEVVNLVNRLDLDPSDTEAAESLRAAARLAPDAFSDAVKEMLYTDVRLLASPVLLEVLVQLDSSEDPPVLHSLCTDAVRDGWARAEGCRHLSEHGTMEDLDDHLLEAIIFHAAPGGWSLLRKPGVPSALLHYHSLAPELVESKLSAQLRHGEAWRRAAAAAATRALLEAEIGTGTRLLSALLDGLRYHEDWANNDEAAGEIASTVAIVLRHAPDVVDGAVRARWPGASPEYRARLIGCFDSLVRHASAELPADVARIVLAQAVMALSEPIDHQANGFEEDYQGRASDLLKLTVPFSPTEVLSSDVLIGLLLTWLEREREFDESQPSEPLGVLEKMGGQARLGGLVRDIADSVVAAGHRDPGAFLVACGELYGGTESAPSVRAEVVRMAGRLAAGSFLHTNNALPLIYTAMLGDDQGVRAAGMEAAEEVMRTLPPESIPPLLAEAVVAGLSDQYLIVVVAAIKAIRRVPADSIDHRTAAVKLLLAARAYAADRLREQMVQDALGAALRLARGDDELMEVVRSAALEIVKLMPAHSARDSLRWQRSLEDHHNWVDVAIHSLRADDNLQYEHLGDDEKEALLAKLGRRRLLARQIEALAEREVEASRLDRRRSLLAADVFGELGRPDLSARMIRAYLDEVQNTIEKRGLRRSGELTLLRFELESAVASGDGQARANIVDRVEKICGDE